MGLEEPEDVFRRQGCGECRWPGMTGERQEWRVPPGLGRGTWLAGEVGKESRVGDRSKLRKELGGCMDGACYVPSRTGQDALPAVPSSSPVGFPEPCPHFANNSFTPWFYTPELHRVSKSSVSLWDQD